MQVLFYFLIALLIAALVVAVWLLSEAREKLAASTIEAEELKKEISSSEQKMDRIGEVFSALEEQADKKIEELAIRNAELERLLEQRGMN